MHPADTLARIAFDRHRERTQLAHRVADGPSAPIRVRVAAGLRGAADRLDAHRPVDVNLSRPSPLRAP
jgi:hypothetical protein